MYDINTQKLMIEAMKNIVEKNIPGMVKWDQVKQDGDHVTVNGVASSGSLTKDNAIAQLIMNRVTYRLAIIDSGGVIRMEFTDMIDKNKTVNPYTLSVQFSHDGTYLEPKIVVGDKDATSVFDLDSKYMKLQVSKQESYLVSLLNRCTESDKTDVAGKSLAYVNTACRQYRFAVIAVLSDTDVFDITPDTKTSSEVHVLYNFKKDLIDSIIATNKITAFMDGNEIKLYKDGKLIRTL